MRKVELQLAAIKCPDYCCKCGAAETVTKTYSEEIALRPITPIMVHVTVPVCKHCASRKVFYYVAAIATLAISMFGFQLLAWQYEIGRYLGLLFLVAIGLYVVAVRSTPIKIIDYRPSTDTITLGVLHDGFAAELATLSGGTDTKYVRVRKTFWLIGLLLIIATVVAVSLVK